MAHFCEVDPALPVCVHSYVETVSQDSCGAQQCDTHAESNDVSLSHHGRFAVAFMDQSCLNAASGSTREARSAGRRVASRAELPSTAIVPRYVTASHGLISY